MRTWTRLVVAALLALVAGLLLVRPYVGFLWMDSLGQSAVFWTRAGASLAAFGVGFLVGSLAVAAQLLVAARLWQGAADLPLGPVEVELRGTRVHVITGRPRLPWSVVLAWALAGGFLVGLASLPLGTETLLFLHRVDFGVTDPVFGRDVSFFLFVLPLLDAVLDRLLLALLLGGGVSAAFYAARGLQRAIRGWRLPDTVARHAQVLLGLVLLLGAGQVAVQRWELAIHGSGLAAGAGYVDVAVRMPALLIFAALCAGGGLLLVATRASTRRCAAVLAVLAVVLLCGLGLAPALVQAWVVAPNEIAVERVYVEQGIASTLRAFGLDKVAVQDYPAVPRLEAGQVERNRDTLENVRLWDRGPLLQTYQQIQALRQYYAFPDADVDRYTVDGRLRQVMVAAREVDRGRLDERALTWVNERLKYTHGYGVAMSPVNAFTPGDGLPLLWVRDLPPRSVPGLEIEQPAIYFGESTDWWVLANSTEGELDYPKGEANIYSHYAGKGGFPVGGPLRRLALALYCGDGNLVLSRAVRPETRLLLYRDLRSRLERLVPFLRMDGDPYLVVAGGRLTWIADLYTATSRHPYSTRVAGVNYVRNSVKALIDAYDGTVRLCVVDPREPILRTWRSIFPSLFVDEAAVEPVLREHFRYPEDLFRVQSEVYQSFHMTEAQVFYNKEDLWDVPKEKFDGETVPMRPYYVVMRLPGEDKLEFLQMLPFTPRGKDNMVAWLGARSDGEHRGQLVLYRFPKERLVYGPSQIEARIDQDPVISEQLSLWDTGGSRVIRGNLLVVPLEDALVYFEPLYLQGSERSIPELKRVIVAIGDRVVMASSLDAAVAAAMRQSGVARTAEGPGADEGSASATGAGEGSGIDPSSGSASAAGPTPGEDGAGVGSARRSHQALEHFRRADEALKQGDWATYGRELEQVRRLLEAMAGEG